MRSKHAYALLAGAILIVTTARPAHARPAVSEPSAYGRFESDSTSCQISFRLKGGKRVPLFVAPMCSDDEPGVHSVDSLEKLGSVALPTLQGTDELHIFQMDANMGGNGGAPATLYWAVVVRADAAWATADSFYSGFLDSGTPLAPPDQGLLVMASATTTDPGAKIAIRFGAATRAAIAKKPSKVVSRVTRTITGDLIGGFHSTNGRPVVRVGSDDVVIDEDGACTLPTDPGADVGPVHLTAEETKWDDGRALLKCLSVQAVRVADPAKHAEACLVDPACPAVDADRLFVAAGDANDPNVDCFRFLDGMGTNRDVTRARACFEHQVGAHPCGGSSADMQTAELAMMRSDGIGGRRDPRGARALLAGCFDDGTRQAVLGHVAEEERNPRTPPADFCDVGGTTLTMNECAARQSKNADTTQEIRTKGIVASLDEAGKGLFIASDKAYGDYVTAMGTFVYQVYIQGSIRGSISQDEESTLKTARIHDLTDLPRFVAKPTSAVDLQAAHRALAAALAKVAQGTSTADERAALQKAQTAWTVYRDAEIAFYQHVFAATQGAGRVHDAMWVRLESRRANECAPPSLGGSP